MISYLEGTILKKHANYAIVKTNSVGYKVFVSQELSDSLQVGDLKELYTYQQVGEQVLALYGLNNFEELSFFELLISISGIGPKTALGVLDVASVLDLQRSILEGSPDLISEASGIGKKTAERVVLELKSKLAKLDLNIATDDSGESQAGEEIDALMALGYSMLEARDALKQVDPTIKDPGEKIRHALRTMHKK